MLYEKDDGHSRVVRAEHAGEAAVLKWVGASAQPRIREELARERAFYRSLGGLACVPDLLDELDAPGVGAGLVLRHHEGKTLRRWLLERRTSPPDAAGAAACADALGTALCELYSAAVAGPGDRGAERVRLSRAFTVLMKSGPLEVPVDERARATNARLHRWGAPLAGRALHRALAALPVRATVAHGDLHPNNVLILPGPRALLLDFGRAEPGECIADLGYLDAALDAALADRAIERAAFAEGLGRTLDSLDLPRAGFARVSAVLRRGAAVNPRLRPERSPVPAGARLALLPALARLALAS